MVSYCCVKGCGNNSNSKKKNPNSILSFHAFPSNREWKSKWLRAIGRPNWLPPAHSRVCSAHFNYDQINYDGCRIRVKDEAVPVNSLPLNSNFEASEVEACRICLATDVRMYSLYNTHLGICMESVAGVNHTHIDGLPQYICYQCAPCLIKCNKLIERCMISQATLLDIFAKNGQITKNLIKEQNKVELNLKSPLNNYVTKYDDVNNTSHFIISESDFEDFSNDNIQFKDDTKTETKMEHIDTEKFEKGAIGTELEGINIVNDKNEDEILKVLDEGVNNNDDFLDLNYEAPDNDEIVSNSDDIEIVKEEVPDEDLNENFIAKPQKEAFPQIKHMKKSLSKSVNSLTPDETNMLKYFEIVQLSLREQMEEWSKSIVRRPLTKEAVYQCDICGKVFANVDSYRVHVTYHDPNLGPAECPVCKLRYKSSALAASHARRAHSKKFFCKLCPKTFSCVGVAKKHQRWHSGYLYKCHSCPFTTLYESSLNGHRLRTHSTAHACPTCGTTYNSERGLQVHTRIAHRMNKETDVTKEHRCEECDVDFASEGARRVHILTSSLHKNKLGSCDTIAQENLRNCCKKCGIECLSLKELVSHTRMEHPRPRQHWREDTAYPTNCELCDERMNNRQKHWQHVRRQHPKEVDTYKRVITAVCDICGKGFQNKTKLHLHQLRHRNPAVRCPSCPQLFYDKYALARHARLHDEVRPHQCRTCGKAFKWINNLERHSRVHTNIAPYQCTMCSKKFKYSSSVNLHVRTVHYKLPHPPRKKRKKSVKDASDS